MKVTFVGLGTEQLGISQLSAYLKANQHTTELAFNASLFNDRFNLEIPFFSKIFDESETVIRDIKNQNPDFLAFSPLTSTYQWSLEIARAAKKINPDLKVVFGGVHASALPGQLIQQAAIDYVVVGEGEHAFLSILHAHQTGDYTTPIANTYFKGAQGKVIRGIQSGFIQDLDGLPFPDKQLWEDHVNMNEIYMTMASRGCPYRCTFCFNSFYAKLPEEKSGKYVRMRSVDHVIAELKQAKKRYQMKWVDFEDDVFATNKNWLLEFTEKYKKEINIPYQILTHPRHVDMEVAQQLKESGCEWIQMGIQSTDDSFKKSLLRYERIEDVERAMESFNHYGLRVKVDHMFGLPHEPEGAQEKALQLYIKTKPARIQTFWTSFLPGTEMMKEAVESGVINAEQERKINEGEEFLFFRNIENVRNPEMVKYYLRYEFLFKIFPILPRSFQFKLSTRRLNVIPLGLLRILAIIGDLIAGFSYSNPVYTSYMVHNLYHLKRLTLGKLGMGSFKATKIYSSTEVKLTEEQISRNFV